MPTKSDNKTLVRNTLFLYFRMFLTLGVSLYTSRVILNVLGIEDYGLYNVVGGVVAMLSFLNGALSGATSRFLSYELGRKNATLLKETFATIFSIHIIFALIVAIILEIFGYWFIANKLMLPEGRLHTAFFVFHFSVTACVIQLIRLPFHAAIISHEKMNAFAYISIFDVVMKLLIVYILQAVDYDKLQAYAILVFIIDLLSSSMYIGFAVKNFSECRLHFKIDKTIAKPVLSFSGWDLYGNISVVARSHGLNILQNTFFGTIVNAATGISNQVLTAIMGFAENFLVAVKPQIIKSYASNEIERFKKLVINSSKYCTLLLFLISFPVMLEAQFILETWLVKVPNYAVIFCQLAIVNNWISIMFRPVIFGVHATGNAKRISLINGSIYLSVLPLSYILLKMGGSPIIPFILNIILLFIGQTFFSLTTFKRYLPEFSIKEFVFQSMVKCLCIGILAAVIPVLLHYHLDKGILRFIVCSFSSVILTCILIYLLGIEKKDKEKLLNYLKTKFLKKRACV